MDAADRRWALELSAGLIAGIGITTLVTGELPEFGFLLGMALIPVCVLAFTRLDGPLDERTARIAAAVLSTGFVGSALWLAA